MRTDVLPQATTPAPDCRKVEKAESSSCPASYLPSFLTRALCRWSRHNEGTCSDKASAAQISCSDAYGAASPSCSFQVNERNQMPDISNDVTSPTHASLSASREKSSIPKYGEPNTVWEYPSSRQFCKALQRRNKDTEPSAIDDVVYVHNRVNEDTWMGILEWERMHQAKCASPSLIRFAGRYNDTTWKAFWKSHFTRMGHPFDRHNWLVDRCGTPVRYIIDYYDDPRKTDLLQVTLDIRPAPDTLTNIYDRLRRPFYDIYTFLTKN